MTTQSDTASCHYVVRVEDLVIVSVGGNWNLFARQNAFTGEEPESVVGQRLTDFLVGQDVRLLYRRLIERVHETRKQVEFPFRCDAPALRRFMRLTMLPHDDTHVRMETLLEREEARSSQDILAQPGDGKLVHMCSMCKRIEERKGVWLELEDAVERFDLLRSDKPRLTHGLCPKCYESAMAALEDGLS